MRYQIKKLSAYLRGWINYFGIATGYQRCVTLDHWIRRRVRMCYWRQWRKVRTRVGFFLKMGVSKKWACLSGLTRKGPWRSAKTKAIQMAISNDFLKTQGLYALRDGWIKLHH